MDDVQVFSGLGVVGVLLAVTLRLMLRNDTATWRLATVAQEARSHAERDLGAVRDQLQAALVRVAELENEVGHLRSRLAALEGDGR